MRSFIAIEIDPEILEKLDRFGKEIGAEIRGRKGSVKWVCPERMHLTLKFLGEVDESLIPEIAGAMDTAAGQTGGFSMEIEGAGTFGRPARVIWAGIRENQALRGLYERLENELVTLGFEAEERDYSPHLTLGRVKEPKAGRQIFKIVENMQSREFGKFDVERICLFKSELTNEGPVYTLLHSSNLVTSHKGSKFPREKL